MSAALLIKIEAGHWIRYLSWCDIRCRLTSIHFDTLQFFLFENCVAAYSGPLSLLHLSCAGWDGSHCTLKFDLVPFQNVFFSMRCKVVSKQNTQLAVYAISVKLVDLLTLLTLQNIFFVLPATLSMTYATSFVSVTNKCIWRRRTPIGNVSRPSICLLPAFLYPPVLAVNSYRKCYEGRKAHRQCSYAALFCNYAPSWT